MRGDYWPGYDDVSGRTPYTEPDEVGSVPSDHGTERFIRGPVPSARAAAVMGRIIHETNAKRKRERELTHSIAAVSLRNETLAL